MAEKKKATAGTQADALEEEPVPVVSPSPSPSPDSSVKIMGATAANQGNKKGSWSKNGTWIPATKTAEPTTAPEKEGLGAVAARAAAEKKRKAAEEGKQDK